MRVSPRQWLEEREEALVWVGTVQVGIGKQSKSRSRMRWWQTYSNKRQTQVLSFIQEDKIFPSGGQLITMSTKLVSRYLSILSVSEAGKNHSSYWSTLDSLGVL